MYVRYKAGSMCFYFFHLNFSICFQISGHFTTATEHVWLTLLFHTYLITVLNDLTENTYSVLDSIKVIEKS